jgi:hypothetical protein
MALLIGLAFAAKRWGQADERAQQAEDDADTSKEIRHALDAAPRDPASLADWLRRSGG